MRFKNRIDAGRQLASRLRGYASRSDVVVLALPRGGVPVAHEVAQRLGVPFDLFLVRKLGVPGHPELAMGAIAEGAVEVLSDDLIRDLGVPLALVRQVAVRERLELDRRDALYRGGRPLAPVRGHVAIVIDDGVATGSTMQAAVLALRRLEPARIVVAVPVGARDTCQRLSRLADEVVCLTMPEPFQAVGLWYETFDQTTDDEVRQLLGWRGDLPRSVAVSDSVSTPRWTTTPGCGKDAMSYRIRRVDYFYLSVKDQPGEAYKLLALLAERGVALLAFTAIPSGAQRTQLTLFPEDAEGLAVEARKTGLVLDGPHPALLIQGDNDLRALAEVHRKLYEADINVYAANGVTDGRTGFGYLIYVRSDDFGRAAQLLGV